MKSLGAPRIANLNTLLAHYGWWQNATWCMVAMLYVCVMQIVAPLNGRRASFYRTTKSAQEGTPQTPASLNAKRLWAIRRAEGGISQGYTLRPDHVRRDDLFGAIITVDFPTSSARVTKIRPKPQETDKFLTSTTIFWVIIPCALESENTLSVLGGLIVMF